MDKIHPKLEVKLEELCSKGVRKGVSLSYAATKNENAGLVYAPSKIAILFIKEEEDCFLVQPYTVDVNKWMWAESEGFTKDDMWKESNLQDMIFTPVTKLQLEKHLGIS